MTLQITERHAKSLSPAGTPPAGAPEWIGEIDNPYLHGVFAPIVEERAPTKLEVLEGELPRDLHGAYFRNGPNPKYRPNGRYHWFDGDGMVHGVWFGDGEARYAARWIRTRGLELEDERAESIWPGVLSPFDHSLPLGALKDTANTDLVAYDGRLIALWYESGFPYALDPVTLETLGPDDLAGKLPSRVSAHSKVDEQTGDLVFFAYGDVPPYMQYGVLTKAGELHLTDVELPGPRRPHDVGMTQNYSVLHDFPVFHDPALFEKTGRRVPLFHREVPTRYGVVPRFGTGDQVRWFEFEPCYMLHVVNTWEEGDWIVMVGCRTNDPTLRPDPEDGKLAAMLSFLKLQANLYEWRMNLVTGETRERALDDLNAEFPTSNLAFQGRKGRYSYHQMIPWEIPATFDALVKYDIQTGASTRWDYGPGVYGSETTFAARPGATEEDDGYLVTLVTDVNDWGSQCLVFDAARVEDGPLARLRVPERVPAGFHATWMDGVG